eukprot:9743239-Alexandrium_andersonii.AAC.1
MRRTPSTGTPMAPRRRATVAPGCSGSAACWAAPTCLGSCRRLRASPSSGIPLGRWATLAT